MAARECNQTFGRNYQSSHVGYRVGANCDGFRRRRCIAYNRTRGESAHPCCPESDTKLSMTSTSPSPSWPETENEQALAGLSVLGFSHALSGPYFTLLMADCGAEVYKLESPHGGELSRGWGPPFAGGEASFFLGLNRGKRGISIDLKYPEGIELCLRLIDQMDV